MEGERDVPEERAQHRRAVALPDELWLADEQVDADRVLAERQSLGVRGVVADAVVLEHADRPAGEMREITVRAVVPTDRLTVVLELGIRIRAADAVVPPAAHVRFEEPAADEREVVFTQ